MGVVAFNDPVQITSDGENPAGTEIVTPRIRLAPPFGTILTWVNRGTLTLGPSGSDIGGLVVGESYYPNSVEAPRVAFINKGLVQVTTVGGLNNNATAVYQESALELKNEGTITARTTGTAGGRAAGILIGINFAGLVNNSGSITAQSDGDRAFGISGGALQPHITNSGTIQATAGAIGAAGIYATGDGARIVNSGTIQAFDTSHTGHSVGIQIWANATNIHSYADIVNTGHIVADVAIWQVEGYSTGVRVTNSGTIDGDLVADKNDNRVFNLAGGTWNGDLNFGYGFDRVVNQGAIAGTISFAAGRDIYDGTGGTLNGSGLGGDGDDILIGGSGVETLNGGAGRDVVIGGGGADQLGGGADADLFVFRAVTDSTLAQQARITDFTSGSDRIDLTELGAVTLAFASAGGDTILTATSAQGSFSLRIAGAATAADVITAASAPVAATSGTDLLHASSGLTELHGLGGDDVLIGSAGADLLDGGTGADLMAGGGGDDIYLADDMLDRVYEAANGGWDTVVSTAEFHILRDNVEALTLGNGAIEGAGNSADNVLTGNALDNILWGGGGNDRFYGGAGDDTYHIDSQSDLVFEDAGGAGGVDKIVASCSMYMYENIEKLTLLEFNHTFLTNYNDDYTGDYYAVGNALNNEINGNRGNNLLLGGLGDDTIRGDDGNDTLYGESGVDWLLGDAGVDYLAGGDGNDKLWGGYGADALYGEDGNDEIDGGQDFQTDILVGGAGNDILHGDSGLADYDLMDGGSGDDVFYVDTGDDLTFEAAGGGTDTVYANVAGVNNGVYLYANVENLVLVNSTAFGVGNDLANTMTGSASGNWLLGGAGNDTLNGKGGNDVLFGEAGADRFVFEAGTGGDVIGDFTVGTDKIDLTAFGLTWQTVANSMHDNGGTTAIDLGNGDFIVINGVAASALSQGDFILSGGSSGGSPAPARIHRDALTTYDAGFQHDGFIDAADAVLQGGPAMGLFDWHQPDTAFHIL